MAEYDQPEIGFTGARFGGPRRRRKGKPSGDLAPAGAPEPAPEVRRAAAGGTGARFAGATRALEPAPPPPSVPAGAPPQVDAPPPPATPAPLPMSATAPARAGVAPSAAGHTVHWPLARPVDAQAPAATDDPASVWVRPYVLTRGRTRSGVHLELETLVSVGPKPPVEHHRVVELCRRPISVAEVAALMGVPLGVARVVVGDLAGQGAVVVHDTAVVDIPDSALLERVLAGLRQL